MAALAQFAPAPVIQAPPLQLVPASRGALVNANSVAPLAAQAAATPALAAMTPIQKDAGTGAGIAIPGQPAPIGAAQPGASGLTAAQAQSLKNLLNPAAPSPNDVNGGQAGMDAMDAGGVGGSSGGIGGWLQKMFGGN